MYTCYPYCFIGKILMFTAKVIKLYLMLVVLRKKGGFSYTSIKLRSQGISSSIY